VEAPTLVGNELKESAVYNCPTLISNNATYANSLLLLLLLEMNAQSNDTEAVAAVEDFYDIAAASTPIAGFNVFQTDFVYKCHAFNLASAFVTSGRPVYMNIVEQAVAYYLSSKTAAQAACYGVPHGSDLLLQIHFLYLENLTPEEYALSLTMRNAWHTFVSNSVPQLNTGLTWHKYTTATREYIGYNVSKVAVGAGLKQEECTLLNAALSGSLNEPGYNPTYKASVAPVARARAWASNGLNYQIFDLAVTNTGDSTITALNVAVTLNGTTITGSWNLQEVSTGVYALPPGTRVSRLMDDVLRHCWSDSRLSRQLLSQCF
jgi:Carboxylesterase family/Carbohydrate binding domain CBM49